MRTPPQPSFPALRGGPQRGYVLLITLAILAGVMTMGLSMLQNAASGRKITAQSRKSSQSRYAAESAIALLINRTANSVDSNGYLVELPSTDVRIHGHRVTLSMEIQEDENGETRMDSIRTKYDLLTYRAYANIEAVATDTITHSAAHIRQRIAFDQYPLFQFATYWEGVMLLDPGSLMTINGRMHCNSRVKLYPFDNLSLEDWITSPCEIWHKSSATPARIRLKRADGALGSWRTLPTVFVPADTPFYGGTKRMRIAYGNTVPIFKMPIGTRNPILIIQPKGVSDRGAPGFTETVITRKNKLVYKADLIFRKRSSGGAIVRQWSRNEAGGGDAPESGSVNAALNSALDTPSVAGNHRDSLYDYGDRAWMNATYVNVQKFFAASTGAGDQIIYLEGQFDTTVSTKKRDVFVLYNAATLARPVTFVSNCPVYIWGSYNRNATKSAAVIGDIITALSRTWNGSYGTATATRTAADDSIYACLMGGVRRARVHTAWNNPDDANYYNWNQDDNANFSDRIGQPHNHLSFMEDWSGKTFTFSGSQVALWRCLHSNGLYRWNPGNTIYTQPNRNYSFDARYNQLRNMPPGTPTVISPFNLDYYEVHEE